MMSNDAHNRELFEQMPIPKASAKLMAPTIAGSLVMILYSLTDTYFVSLPGDPIQSAAVALAAPVLLAFNAANNLFGIGSSGAMSRALGRKDFDAVRKSASVGIYGALALAVFISLLCALFPGSLVKALGADAETSGVTLAYLRWTVTFGAVPAIMNVVFAYLVRAEGAALHAGLGTMSGCILNMILDPFFILPWGLNMGAEGAGLATFLSGCFASVYFIIMLLIRRDKTMIRLHPKYFRPERRLLKEIFGVGVPAAIQNLLNVIGMTILNNCVTVYGTAAVAAMGIARKIYMVPMQVVLGASQGIMPLIGYNYGCRNTERFRETIFFTMKLAVSSMVVLTAACLVWSAPLIRLFMDDAEVVRYGTQFLCALALSLPFMVVDFQTVGVMQSVGRGSTSLLMAITRKIVLEIPAIVLLDRLFLASGIAYSALVAELIMCLMGMAVLWRLFRELGWCRRKQP